ISIGISDMIIPKEKQVELENAYKQIRQVEQQYRKGIITDGERYNKIIDIWTHAGDEISNVMFRTLEHNDGRKELNPVYLMVDSGYLTRKLVDAEQDVIINVADCGTVNGIVVRSIYEGDEEVVDLAQRIIGRVSCETIADPVEKKKKIVKANQLIDEKIANELQRIGVERLKIRSVRTCETGRGVRGMGYGEKLATGRCVRT